jgi:DNA anti-recombination protein RmuC
MMRLFYIFAVMLFFAVTAGLPAATQAQDQDGYAFVNGIRGPEVCVGQYTAPSSSDVNGICRGELMGLQQFSAAAARQSADSLDRIVSSLEAIDQKLAANNEQLQRLTEASADARGDSLREEMARLKEAIASRFEAIPEELISSPEFKDEMDRLKADIIAEVNSRLSPSSKNADKKRSPVPNR